jgi:Lrp/AsnC family leucine-responsive transcriptional regulator
MDNYPHKNNQFLIFFTFKKDMKGLDKLDLKLILELEKDSRQSLSKISKTLKTSQQVISYRLKKLKDQKFITKFGCLVNYFKLGYKNYKIFIKLKIINSKKEKQIYLYLKNKKNVLSVYRCSNNYNLIINTIFKTNSDLYLFFNNFRNKFYNIVENYIITICLENYYYPRDYLLNKYRSITKEIKITDNQSNIEPIKDTNTNKILKELTKNSNIRVIKLCSILHKKPKWIIGKIKEMSKNNIILRRSPILDLKKNIFTYILLIKYNCCREEKEENIILFFKSVLNVIYISKMLGEADLLVYIEIENMSKLQNMIYKYNNQFYKNTKNIEIINIYNKYKESLF